MKINPIPAEALDDRLAFIGTSGSGKTYSAGTAVERLLADGARVVIVDPLDVWHGLRLKPDGKTPSPFNVVIFGGAHGDLPLNEHAGKLIGETVATMSESCIVSLGGLATKSAERRFMLAFLDAIYRKTNPEKSGLFHLVFDEADLWAPQKSSEPMLQNRMEEIVRRGRVKGFIPWLITQRPAVLSKDVLSQADGMIAFKLTASQDRAALGAWIEGSADKTEGKAILDALPAMQIGHGVVWLPARGILKTVAFPAKMTFDSSRTPKRGERRQAVALNPIDLGALQDRLTSIEEETKANDPAALKSEIAALKRELAKKPTVAAVPDTKALANAEQHGFTLGHKEGHALGFYAGWNRCKDGARIEFGDMPDEVAPKAMAETRTPPARRAPTTPTRPAPTTPQPMIASASDVILTAPQARVLEALSFWFSIGIERPTRIQVGVAASYSPKSGNFNNILGGLRNLDLIDYPASGLLTLTELGHATAPALEAKTTLERVTSILSASQQKVLIAILDHGAEITRADLGLATDYSAKSGNFNNLLGSLRSLGLIEYLSPGVVVAHDWLNS